VAIFTRGPERVDMPTAPWAGPGAGRDGGGLRPSARALAGQWRWLVAAAVAVAGTLVGVEVANGTTTYPLGAVFARAPGLFPGAAVEVLGVPVGTVTSVRPVGDEVKVGLAIDHGRPIPAAATAALVSPELLGEPSIELSPGYTGGATLASGAVIPMTRTAVPVSTEQVLKALYRTLEHVSPHAVGGLVTNLAKDLNGQGKGLHTLIAGAAGTLKLLATKADDLGRLSGSLAQLTGTLDSRTAQITQLITDYDTVSGVVASHGSQLGGAVVQLSQASTQLVKVLVPNLGPIESDVGTVTTVGRTLDRNLTSVDGVLASAASLFTGARRAYTPTYNWITLNAQLPAGLSGALLATQVRHRLEGVCRRLLAHRSAGLSATERKTLETCGNPRSAFFNPIVSQIGTVLQDVREGKTPTTTPAKMFKQGLSKIPGASSASPTGTKGAGATGTTPPPAPGPSTPGGGTSGGSGSGGSGGTTGGSSGTCLLNVLGLLTCKGASASSSSGSGGTSTVSGSNGLLAYDVPNGAPSRAPSLSAHAARYLPPLPSTAPGAARTTASRRGDPQTTRARRHRRDPPGAARAGGPGGDR
jgi:phospholipid/cholesterol/gamma-HCH transport system substrate-binding protein